MDEHICIGVTEKPSIVLKTDAAQPQFAVLGKLVDIKSKSYAYFHIFIYPLFHECHPNRTRV